MYNGKRVPTDAEILAQIPAATERAHKADLAEPRAAAAAYDRGTGRVRIDLTNGCAFEFPAGLAQGLEHAAPDDLALVEVYPGGEGLRWDRLDVDLSVPGLLAGVFGGGGWMGREMGKKGGSARTQSKAAAARENGKRGGRPRKNAEAQS
ncbi:DUF2442 domain-containing protein [Longimicrobium sp.]|uniref:DUF2442 domain-containing protein n=1 Tax=Longimicrobium sp. TaxID=2029185 RepID=UPI003B3B1AF6